MPQFLRAEIRIINCSSEWKMQNLGVRVICERYVCVYLVDISGTRSGCYMYTAIRTTNYTKIDVAGGKMYDRDESEHEFHASARNEQTINIKKCRTSKAASKIRCKMQTRAHIRTMQDQSKLYILSHNQAEILEFVGWKKFHKISCMLK